MGRAREERLTVQSAPVRISPVTWAWAAMYERSPRCRTSGYTAALSATKQPSPSRHLPGRREQPLLPLLLGGPLPFRGLSGEEPREVLGEAVVV
ncbi:hypothetical protein ACH5A2_31035 [Streptomyces collinus]|uniref:hypothetical protein n=1 Tax=Streptomyces collinus TaxID=42684 RepID=UPI00378D0C9A